MLDALTAAAPLVVVLEDLHWASTETLDLLEHVACRLDGRAVLVVATHRDPDPALTGGSPLTMLLATLARLPGHEAIHLAGLGTAGYDAEPAVATTRCPFVYVGGAMPAGLDRLRALCPQVEVAELRGRGHFLQLTDPQAVNEVLEGFVARVEASAQRSVR